MSLRKWIRNWLNREDIEQPGLTSNEKYANMAATAMNNPTIGDYGNSGRINFSVVPARGGVIVTARNYDNRKGDHDETIHLIHDGEDVAMSIGHIVSMELLKR